MTGMEETGWRQAGRHCSERFGMGRQLPNLYLGSDLHKLNVAQI